MNKLKNNGIIYVAISLAVVCLLSLGITVSASQTFKQMLAESVAKIIAPQIVNDISNEVTDTSDQLGAVSGPDYYWDYQNFNGLTTYVKTGGLVGNATTTILSLKNPAGTTSTVDLVRLTQTAVATTLPGASIISSGSVATGTNFYVIENGITYGTGVISGGSVSKISVGTNEYLNCVVTPSLSTYWTTTTNAFAGKYTVRFIK